MTTTDGTTDRSGAAAIPRQRPTFDTLRRLLCGTLAEPHEPGYDEHVTPWNLAVAMRPAAVVAAYTADDVATAIRFAGEAGLTVGVQATGHGAAPSLAGHVLVATRHLDEVVVHPQGWARVGAGVKWARVIEVAAPHGLAPLNGSASDVGVVGYLTGGGVGPMARTFGLAADSVRAFEVVTGDGVLRRVTPTQHPDLFFALRGGKGAAGIVTAVEIDLVRMPSFYGGAVYFDGAHAAAVIDAWRRWSEDLPEQGTTSFALFRLPPLPFVPPPLAGRLTIGIRFLWTGEEQEGARLLDEMRAVAPVVLDDAEVKPYTAVDSVHADPVDPMPAYEASLLLDDFPQQAAEALLAVTGPASDSPQVLVEIRQLGGALGRQGEHPAAFDHRGAAYSLLTVGMAPDPAVPGHAHQVLAALSGWGSGRVWPNFQPVHDALTAQRAYDATTLERLAAVTRTYDPAGVLAAGGFTRLVPGRVP